MTTNLLYIGKSKSFLTQFGKLEDVQLIYAKDHKDAITICINLKARENIIILYEPVSYTHLTLPTNSRV